MVALQLPQSPTQTATAIQTHPEGKTALMLLSQPSLGKLSILCFREKGERRKQGRCLRLVEELSHNNCGGTPVCGLHPQGRCHHTYPHTLSLSLHRASESSLTQCSKSSLFMSPLPTTIKWETPWKETQNENEWGKILNSGVRLRVLSQLQPLLKSLIFLLIKW